MKNSPVILPLLLLAVSCAQKEDLPHPDTSMGKRELGFDISVTRDGKQLNPDKIATRAGGA